MEFFAIAILAVFGLIGFIAIFFTTFGTLIILLGALAYAFLTGFTVINEWTMFILVGLYLVGELLEYALVAMGAKKFGASGWAIAGALVGGAVGAAAGLSVFGIGIFAGTLIGIFAGAFLMELLIHQNLGRSLKAGVGGLLGRFGSIIAKVFIAITMFGVLAANFLRLGRF